MIVEDEISMLRLLKRMLEKLNYTVLAANSPGEAIELAERHPGRIYLFLTDVIMPEMSGRLNAFRPSVKTLYMSGYTANEIAHRGVLDRGVNFIQKPFPITELAAKVRKMLRG